MKDTLDGYLNIIVVLLFWSQDEYQFLEGTGQLFSHIRKLIGPLCRIGGPSLRGNMVCCLRKRLGNVNGWVDGIDFNISHPWPAVFTPFYEIVC